MDLRKVLAESFLVRDYFDLINVDSFGGDSSSLRASFEAIRFGGHVYLTSTDGFSFGGQLPQQCQVEAITKKGVPSRRKIYPKKSISMQAVRPPHSPATARIIRLLTSLCILQPSPANALEQMHSITKMNLDNISQFLVLADLDPAAAKTLIGILGPFLSASGFLFILRIVMSWYPKLPIEEFPYVIAYAPTEPFLRVTRKLIPPVGGVDITPVVWFGLLSFLNEILVGPQGLLVLLSQQV